MCTVQSCLPVKWPADIPGQHTELWKHVDTRHYHEAHVTYPCSARRGHWDSVECFRSCWRCCHWRLWMVWWRRNDVPASLPSSSAAPPQDDEALEEEKQRPAMGANGQHDTEQTICRDMITIRLLDIYMWYKTWVTRRCFSATGQRPTDQMFDWPQPDPLVIPILDTFEVNGGGKLMMVSFRWHLSLSRWITHLSNVNL